MVTVIGVDGAVLPPGGAEAMAGATLVAGARHHLQAFAPAALRQVELEPIGDALAALAQGGPRPVVLVSGDPGFFGIVRALRQYALPVRVIPAVSTVQRVAARVGRSWDDMAVVSVHGGDLAPALNLCRARRAVAVLTAPGAGPAEIGAGLAGWRRTLVVAEQPGSAAEQLSTVDAAAAAARSWREPNLVLCLADPADVSPRGWLAGGEPTPLAGGWAMPEDAFTHRDGMILASEVRAVALARLGPRPGTLVWDVGAGCGAVAVDCARMGAAVVAVEQDAGQCVRVLHSAARFGVDVRLVEGQAPAALAGLPVPDAVFVGGCGPEVLAACAASGAARIVVVVARFDRVADARDVLRAAGYAVSGCQLGVARLAGPAAGADRLTGSDPVFLLCGEGAP